MKWWCVVHRSCSQHLYLGPARQNLYMFGQAAVSLTETVLVARWMRITYKRCKVLEESVGHPSAPSPPSQFRFVSSFS